MTTNNQCAAPDPTPDWHNRFLQILPGIQAFAKRAFRHLRGDSKDEAIAEVVANTCQAYVRLVERGRADLAHPTILAGFAVRQYLDGRRTGTKLNIRDVTSPYCQAMKDIHVGRLDRYDEQEEAWQEILVADKNATPAELAASRIDFPAWLDTLDRRDRRIALKLSTGETTARVAEVFRLSAGRVSQLRRELMESWQRFVGEEPVPVTA